MRRKSRPAKIFYVQLFFSTLDFIVMNVLSTEEIIRTVDRDSLFFSIVKVELLLKPKTPIYRFHLFFHDEDNRRLLIELVDYIYDPVHGFRKQNCHLEAEFLTSLFHPRSRSSEKCMQNFYIHHTVLSDIWYQLLGRGFLSDKTLHADYCDQHNRCPSPPSMSNIHETCKLTCIHCKADIYVSWK